MILVKGDISLVRSIIALSAIAFVFIVPIQVCVTRFKALNSSRGR